MPRKDKKKSQSAPAVEVIGRVQMTREGYGFIIVENEPDNDVFVKASKMRGALNGDTVKVVIRKDRPEQGKSDSRRRPSKAQDHREGEVIEIIERSRKPFVGVLQIVQNKAWVLMESRVMPYDISVPMSEVERTSAVSGMKVAVRIVRWERRDPEPVGEIVDVLGMPGENDTEMHAILAEYQLPYRFEPKVEKAAAKLPEDLTPEEFARRKDFRDVLTFTIDPFDAKDFDDALSVRRVSDTKWEIGVHIADVTHYVRPGTLVDKEALNRATSVYLVDRTVPMLPEMLSNKLCSLRPGENKLCFSAVFTISESGVVSDRWIGRTVICSDWRFDYDAAQRIIEGNEPENPGEFDLKGDDKLSQRLREAVLVGHKIASCLRKARFDAGAVSFERPEMKVIIDEKGRPIDVRQKISKEANWLVEEFMLLANRTVAEVVAKIKKTFVYRVHEEPNQDKIGSLRSFVANFGYKMGPTTGAKDISKSLNGLFEEAKGKPEADVIELLALRCMARAHYTTDNCGHYGLAFAYYTHFTSPIRRYPDMMVHRLLAKYLEGGASQNKKYYEELCKYCSEREQIAADAERASIKYKLVEFMQDKVGYEFDGSISGLTEWGMYVEIEPTKIEGMVALRDISGDYYEFDPDSYRIVGKTTGKIYTLGDKVRIRVRKANLEQKLLDYDLVTLPGDESNDGQASVQKQPSKPSKPSSKKEARKGASTSKGSKKSSGKKSSGKSRSSSKKKSSDKKKSK